MYYERPESTSSDRNLLKNPWWKITEDHLPAFILDEGYNSAEKGLKRIPSEHGTVLFAAVTYPWTVLLWGSIHKPTIK